MDWESGKWLIGLCGTAFGSVALFVLNGMKADHRDTKEKAEEATKQAQENKLSLAQYQTFVAQNYEDKGSVQRSLAHVHERIDRLSAEIKTESSQTREAVSEAVKNIHTVIETVTSLLKHNGSSK